MESVLRYISFLLTLFFVAGCSSNHKAVLDPTMKVDFMVDDFRTSRRVTLSQSLAPVTLVHFWATWCPQCVHELRTFENLQNKLAGTGFKVITIALNSEPFKIQELIASNKLTYTVWIDPEGDSQKALSAPSIPYTVLLDSKGYVIKFNDPNTKELVTSVAGARQWDTPQVVESFNRIVDGRKIL